MKKLIVVIILACTLLATGAQAAWASPPATNPIIHIVQWGENLIGIANRYGTTVWAIMQANSIANQNRIYAGQRLVIPVAAATPVTSACSYVVCYGDNLTGIAYRYGVSISSIMRANGIVNPNMIYPGQRLAIPCAAPAPAPAPSPAPAPGGTYYTVRWGDTLAKIAMRFGVSTWSIVKANNIANPNVIYPGRRLFIPTGAPGPAPAQPSTPGCEHLTWPRSGAVLNGIVEARGTADLTNFWYYKLEFRKDGLDNWHYITGAETPVRSGSLGKWDTGPLVNGGYTFRLVVVDRTGNYPAPCEIPVQIRH